MADAFFAEKNCGLVSLFASGIFTRAILLSSTVTAEDVSYRAASGLEAGLSTLKKRFVLVKLTLRCSARLHESNLVSYLPGPGEFSLSYKLEDAASRVGEGDLFFYENRGVPMLME